MGVINKEVYISQNSLNCSHYICALNIYKIYLKITVHQYWVPVSRFGLLQWYELAMKKQTFLYSEFEQIKKEKKKKMTEGRFLTAGKRVINLFKKKKETRPWDWTVTEGSV